MYEYATGSTGKQLQVTKKIINPQERTGKHAQTLILETFFVTTALRTNHALDQQVFEGACQGCIIRNLVIG